MMDVPLADIELWVDSTRRMYVHNGDGVCTASIRFNPICQRSELLFFFLIYLRRAVGEIATTGTSSLWIRRPRPSVIIYTDDSDSLNMQERASPSLRSPHFDPSASEDSDWTGSASASGCHARVRVRSE